MQGSTPAPVLIIDDNPSASKTMRLVLAAEGYEADSAATAAEALDMAKKKAYDAALIDISLPDRSGIELLTELNDLFPDIVSIIVTGHSSVETSIEALNRGANGYVKKPVEVQQLLSLLRSGLEKKRLEEANWRMLRRLSLLHVIGATVGVGLDPAETLTETISLVVSLLDLEAGGIWWCRGLEQTPELVAAVGLPDNLAEVFTERARCLLAEIAANPKLSEQPWFDLQEGAGDESTEWQLRLIPLRGQKDLMGCMAIGGRNWFEGNSEEVEFLGAVAGQVGVAMENMRLYDDLRLTHERLQDAQTKVVQAEKLSAVGRAVSGVAHEINNPLMAIMGFSELLAEENAGELTPDLSQRIYSQAKRCAKIVESLLSFARQKHAPAAAVDLNAVIHVALSDTEHERTHNTRVSLDLDPGLPEIGGSPAALRQVFVNIITNACQAMEPEGGTLTIVSERRDGDVLLRFADTGPGIPEAALARIFDPFYTTKAMGQGTGLGLSVSHGIVHEYGGEITARNQPEGGAAFELRLPTARDGRQDRPIDGDTERTETEGVGASAS